MEAGGRGAEAEAFLRWAAAQRLTVVRVLAMAKHLFDLPPDRGVAALDALLSRAERHGLAVEVVALADTASYPLDLRAHVRRIGEICARHANALVEIANEPYHGTQRDEVHDPAFLMKLRAEVPPAVPVALGAGDYPRILSGGDYVTVHYPRSSSAGGWGWVAALKDGAAHLREAGKPVIDDEPIGAGEKLEPGRRDPSPERYRAAALAARITGLGSTFHYEGGLQARVPQGNERACFHAWQEAWGLVPGASNIEPFDAGPGSPVRGVRGRNAGVFLARRGETAWALVIGAGSDAAIEWSAGWRVSARRTWPQSRFYAARRVSARTPRSAD